MTIVQMVRRLIINTTIAAFIINSKHLEINISLSKSFHMIRVKRRLARGICVTIESVLSFSTTH